MIVIYQWIAAEMSPTMSTDQLTVDAVCRRLDEASFESTTHLRTVYDRLRSVFGQVDDPRACLRAGMYSVEEIVAQWNDGNRARISEATAVLCVVDRGGRVDWADPAIASAFGFSEARRRTLDRIADEVFKGIEMDLQS